MRHRAMLALAIHAWTCYGFTSSSFFPTRRHALTTLNADGCPRASATFGTSARRLLILRAGDADGSGADDSAETRVFELCHVDKDGEITECEVKIGRMRVYLVASSHVFC